LGLKIGEEAKKFELGWKWSHAKTECFYLMQKLIYGSKRFQFGLNFFYQKGDHFCFGLKILRQSKTI